MPLPLEGIRVLDWTIWQQGSACGAMLGDMGADVIKIEQAGTGDPGRYLIAAGGQSTEDKPNWYFEANNRNKRSITLDLKQPEALEVVLALAAESDVFIQNFRFGVAERLGVGYEALRAVNPKLIYGSATGYGNKGDESAEPSFDHLGLARSGIMNAAGEPGMPPLAIAGGVADQMGAIMLAYGIMTALVARERHGVGQEVNASHLGSMTFLQGLSVSMKLMAGLAIPRTFRHAAINPLWNHYRCQDDQWIALAMLQPDRYWADFTRIMGLTDLTGDPRFDTMTSRTENSEACIALLDEAFATQPRDEWIRRIKEDGADLIYTIVNSVDDLPNDPQVRANGYITEVDHPQHGTTEMLGVPVALSETPGSIRRVAPELGEHTEEVLLDVLGWDWDRIGALREKKVI
ncbi:MAG: CaiB/BaiF CoA transferase family protein [Myxococcota bacterium]|nr:carnitine dehydratase [Spirochaeta sp.]RPG12479.1 MAG: CoA transferase [Proteobacteria bacterium TMED72]